MTGGVSLWLRIAVILACVAFLYFTLHQIKRRRLLIRYSLLWLAFSVVMLVVAISPNVVFSLGKFLGFDVASNFIFAVGLFFVLVLCLSQARAMSQQVVKNKRTIQQIALLEKRIEDIEEQAKDGDLRNYYTKAQ